MQLPTTIEYSDKRPAPRQWPGALVPAIFTALFWAYILISRQIEIPGFIRFMTETAVKSLWLLAVLIWWLSRRRVSWKDRLLVLGVLIGTGAVVYGLSYKFIFLFFILMIGLPIVATAWIIWLVVSQRLSPDKRRIGSFVAIAIAWAVLLPLRMDGLTGTGGFDLHWRWTPTGENLYLANRPAVMQPVVLAEELPDVPASTDWPDFRGVNHDGIVRGLKIETDWKAHPPTKLWRQRIGPGWSSMTVIGSRLYTQEQRGEDEAVVCLDANSGLEIWAHIDPDRFSDPLSGTGPRATPVYDHGRLYAVGGRGMVNCLDAKTGNVIWKHDLFAEAGGQLPVWGYASTPLLINDRVIVYDGRKTGKGVVALDAKTGAAAWNVPMGEMGYASAQRASLGGTEQILMYTDVGVEGLNPADGTVLWKHEGKASGPRSVQPHAVSTHQVLLADGLDLGMTLLDVAPANGSWSIQKTWGTKMLKPSFNDVVIDNGHVYGLDGKYLACIDLATGQRAWRGGRDGEYGTGQLVLLEAQHLLLIVSDKGEVALASADPSAFHELGRFEAIEGKTWNHPAIAHGRIFVRNAEEIACYQLPEMK